MTDPVVDPGTPSPTVASPVASTNSDGSATVGVVVNADGSISATSGTGAAATTEGNTSGDGTPPTTTAETPPAAAGEKPKVDNVQKRINELTYRRLEAERTADQKDAALKAAEARTAELLKQLETKASGAPGTNGSTPPMSTTEVTEAEIEKRAAEKAILIAQANEFNKTCNEIVEVGKKDYGVQSWDEAIKNLNLVGALGKNVSSEFLETVVELKNPSKILHHLGQNFEEAEKLVKMTPVKRAMELARVEAALNAPPAPPPAPVSQAPAPVIPVAGGASKAGIPDLTDSATKMSDWVTERQRQLEEKRNRYKRA